MSMSSLAVRHRYDMSFQLTSRVHFVPLHSSKPEAGRLQSHEPSQAYRLLYGPQVKNGLYIILVVKKIFMM